MSVELPFDFVARILKANSYQHDIIAGTSYVESLSVGVMASNRTLGGADQGSRQFDRLCTAPVAQKSTHHTLSPVAFDPLHSGEVRLPDAMLTGLRLAGDAQLCRN